MNINFIVTKTSLPRKNQITLSPNNWDDFSYKTQFFMTYYDETGRSHDIGNLKIGYIGQKIGWTTENLPPEFPFLEREFFSLGQEVDYYANIAKLPPETSQLILESIRDIVHNTEILETIKNEAVFSTSLMRHTSLSSINHQYRRILKGGDILTEFNFSFEQNQTAELSQINLDFFITPDSRPPTNMHVLIGRNGVGKTTLLNNMVSSILDKDQNINSPGKFYESKPWGKAPISKDYFSSIISVSFSAFDPFDPPANQPDRSKGVCYYYIGLKNRDKANTQLKATADLCTDFIDSFNACFNQARKRKLWLASVEKLNFDINFKEIGLLELITFINDPKFESRLKQTYLRMSSGHAIVLLTLTNLIANIEEKSLILIDEPESHLHPPLLSAFTRTLSDLLIERNGVAIIATHSPVVLQEVPKSCVWKLYRVRLESTANRPQDETFGENVGTLTREVFGLEVSNSGFHALLRQSVSEKKTYEQIIEEYKGQLGYEGRSILRSLISPSLKGDEKTS